MASRQLVPIGQHSGALVSLGQKIDMMELLSNTPQCKKLAEDGLAKYGQHVVGEQAQIGRQLVV